MKSIREIALECAVKFDPMYREADMDEESEKFFEAFIAAYLAQQEPVATVYLIERRTDEFELGAIFNKQGIANVGDGDKLFLEPPIKPGFVMVPVKPTEAMCKVIRNEHDIYGSAEELYAMVIQAAQENSHD